MRGMNVNPAAEDRRLVRLLVIILLGSWLVGTALVLQANAIAPTAPAAAVDLARLHDAWGWYAAGYALFFVADGSIALLGAALLAWLRPQGGFRGLAILVLFALSGVMGVLADLQMLGAAQVFRLGSPALTPATAAAWLDNLNTSGNWLSGASFLPCGVAAWLACGAARDAGVGRGWIAFTEFGAVYQIATGLVSAAAFLTGQAILTDIALLAAIIGSPVFVAVWLIWMMREMSTFPNRRKPS
jgi:hypothetical protein